MRADLSLVVPEGAGWVVDGPAPSEEGRPMVDGAKRQEDVQQEHKRWLVKAARMYAMCRKAGVAEPLDVTGLAVAAFEDMPLKHALVFVRSNEQNIEDLAWAFSNSNSAAEFEQKVKEIKYLPDRGEDPPA
jgi:hypothetical protein